MLKKSRIFLVIILITSVFSVTLSSNFLKYTPNTEASPDKTIELFDLKSSGPQINITTPENETYYGPMSGYYPGSWSFDNDQDGTIPQGWVDNSQSGCTARVVSEKIGHKKTVHLNDNSGNKIYFDNYFSAQTYGIIELWILAEDVSYNLAIRTDDGSTQMFYFSVGLDKWTYVDSTGTVVNIPAFDGVYDPIDNTWYHLTIHFRCNGAPSYMGLNQNKYKLIVDGYESGELEARTNVSFVERLDFASGAVATTDYWVDAVGFSWDTDYTLGDNFNEGILLSYDTSFSPDWLGYSLDGASNKTIMGNTTIPFPSEGVHNIQVFGNNSIGTMFQSEIRYFEIDTSPPVIQINSPDSDQFFGIIAPTYEIFITESHLNTTWYSLNNGITNITFSGLIGTINQTLWDNIIDGDVSMIFYANDTWGFEGYTTITVRKDTEPPVSLITYTPYGVINIVNKSTTFTINTDDGTGSGVSIIRYKINDSTWIEYTGPFDLSSYTYGDYEIIYQTIDNVGNIEDEKSIIVTLIEIPTKQPGIPGYHLFVILGVISIVSAVIIKKRFKSQF